MGFDALLGNERLKQNLVRSLHSGRISHFYLISGPQGSGKKTLAQLLGQASPAAPVRPATRCCTTATRTLSPSPTRSIKTWR